MRLTPFETDAIQRCARRHFGECCVVRLFGSRADDARRGGDIDLHIEAETIDKATLARELAFRKELKDIIGEQQVDVLVRAPDHTPRAIDQIAVETGIRL
jgi:predicted nucleotidyltransferase